MVLDPDDNFYLINLSILIICLPDNEWILWGEITLSLPGVKGQLGCFVYFFFIDTQTTVGIQSLKPLHNDPINTLIQEYFKYIKKPTDNYRDLSTRSWQINISFPEKGRGNQRLVLLLFITFRVVRNPSREFLNSHNVKVAQKPFQTLGHIFAKPKDPVTKEQQTDTSYPIPCNDCDNQYIGQIKRQFGTRLREHQKAVIFCKKENSALSEHTRLTNHTIG